ncbi:phytosulfokines 4-like [Phragmites australis]|uniref:phytosulfokines 4-like n=1 Tax=Phragmites australis TaxID=29695 RepID=UPI002D7A0104|nr:phytosulfokines 4-like [Phragmites australis]
MAPPPPRRTSLLLLSLLLLLLLSVVSHAAKEAAAGSRRHAELQDVHGEVDEEAMSFTAAAADERCGGAGGREGEGDEECLMRRTLVAHTDYIYTQGSHN